MLIRKATEVDIDSILDINVEVQDLHQMLRPAEFKPGAMDDLRATFLGILSSQGLALVVVELEGDVVAYTLFEVCRLPENAFKRKRDFLLVHQIAVKSRCRRKGIATALFLHIRECAAESGLARIEIDVYSRNAEARLFYQSVGFSAYREIMEINLAHLPGD